MKGGVGLVGGGVGVVGRGVAAAGVGVGLSDFGVGVGFFGGLNCNTPEGRLFMRSSAPWVRSLVK